VLSARILWIEGKRADSPQFIDGLRRQGYLIETVSTGEEALRLLSLYRQVAQAVFAFRHAWGAPVIARLLAAQVHLAVINAASLRSSGKRICRSLRQAAPTLPLLVIVAKDKGDSPDPCANVTLALDFTLRKLINRLEQLLPWDDNNILAVGPFLLDEAKGRVRCEGREAPLTPRLVHLLKLFLEHRGEALERDFLFTQVWKTDFVEDTRALDVHISWLRRAIEADPRHPVYLKTIRGLGYRLDV
jgi:DNA-binding response OmpR family regulator